VAEPVLRLANIQGDVIPGFHRSHEMFLFLAVDDAAAARVWLAGQAEGVTSAEDVMGLRRPDRDGRRMGEAKLRSAAVWRNVALGRGGFALLGLDPDRMADEAFRGGMAARSVDLGDPREPARPGHPSKWSVGGAANPADVLVILASDDAECPRCGGRGGGGFARGAPARASPGRPAPARRGRALRLRGRHFPARPSGPGERGARGFSWSAGRCRRRTPTRGGSRNPGSRCCRRGSSSSATSG
jgi:hypothetical protein